MANQADFSDESNNSSDEDFANFYSGAAKRFKTQKQAVFTNGVVKLVKKSGDTSDRKIGLSTQNFDGDSSDEEIFREVDLKKDDCTPDDCDDSKLGNFHTEVLEEVEECEHFSPDISMNYVEERKVHSSPSSPILVEEEFSNNEDPLFCDSLNDSELNPFPDDTEKVVVKVRFVGQKVWRIELKRADYFKNIINELSEKASVDAGKISLYFNDQLLDPYDSLKTVPIKIVDIIDAVIIHEGDVVANTNENTLEFKIQSKNRNSQVVISIRPEDPMKVLMQKYADAVRIDLTKLTFKFDGDKLEEDDTPLSLELEGGECIDAYFQD